MSDGPQGPTPKNTRRLAAIVFADIAGYTELSSRDEDLAVRLIGAFQQVAREAVTAHRGRVVKFLGDGLLAEFSSLDSAVGSAHALQSAFATMPEVLEAGVALRVGVHLGDVVFGDDGDVYGSGVNVASRIESHAPLSGVVVSDSAYRQLRSRRAYTFSSIGEHALKGVPDPMELYVVLLEGQTAPAPAVRVIKEAAREHSPFWSFLRWAFAITLMVIAAVYAADVGGVREGTVDLAATLGISPGSSPAVVETPSYEAIEGGAVVRGPITLRFSKPIDPATATSSNIQLLGPLDERVPIQVSVGSNALSIDLTPETPFAYGARYRIVLTQMLRSASGKAIELPRGDSPLEERLAFATRPPPDGAPVLVSSDPADGAENVPTSGVLTLTFDQLIDPTTVDLGTVVLLDAAQNPVPTLLECCGDSGLQVEVTTDDPLSAGAYSIRMRRGIADLDGELLSERSVNFEVREPAAVAVVVVVAPTGPGSLMIQVVPPEAGSRTLVYLDGESVGPAPTERLDVRENVAHRVEIFGTSPLSPVRLSIFSQSVTLKPGQTLTLDAEITPFGTVSLTSEPAGQVFIDGVEVGPTPLAPYPVAADVSHTLEIRPTGAAAETHLPYSVTFTVEPLGAQGLGRIRLRERG